MFAKAKPKASLQCRDSALHAHPRPTDVDPLPLFFYSTDKIRWLECLMRPDQKDGEKIYQHWGESIVKSIVSACKIIVIHQPKPWGASSTKLPYLPQCCTCVTVSEGLLFQEPTPSLPLWPCKCLARGYSIRGGECQTLS